MQPKIPVSVFIIAKNEADRIATAIHSVRDWVSEIILVDSGSDDDTVSVSQFLGVKTYYREWDGYGMQKRFAEDQCHNRWMLCLDADEEITPELGAEIRALFANGLPKVAAYTLQIRDLLPGEIKLAPMAHTNFVIRLYDRNKGRFSPSPVHDSVIVEEGETVMLNNVVLHRSFRSLAHAVEKINSYSSVQARQLQEKGVVLPYVRLFIEFPIAFFKCYILRLYIVRGMRGFLYACAYGFGRFLRIAKYLELRRPEN